MKFDSIKSRLVLMTLICVLGMGLLVVSQHYFTQRLIVLNQQRDVLLRMGQDLLQMRRHEKDFLLRHDKRYFEKFAAQSTLFTERLDSLVPTFDEYQLPIKDVESLSVSIDNYTRKFQQVVSLQDRIGLNANSGLRGQISSLENTLSSQPSLIQSGDLLPSLKLAVRNFQLTQESRFARQIDALSLSMLNANNANPSSLVTLNQYRNALQALVDGYTAFGLTHNEGLRGEFRQSAHNVESQLQLIDTALQPIIEEQEAQVRIYSLSIAALTSVVLVLVLIKSFATFHRAFANFVMFFYRCKRQYQKIDTKQLGFAEFKSLAELANEMVESRRDIEARLASVEAELASKKVT